MLRSAMKLLLDQGLPRNTAVLLRDASVDTIHVGEIGFSAAEDAEIIQKGLEEIITLDADFHAILALTNAKKPSVIRIRLKPRLLPS